MAAERRNLYRILYVQPEAPQEVIKASYRALMSTLRAHPDLGGDHEHAARLNGAYAVLGDPEQRRQYDRSLRRPVRGAAAEPPPTLADPAAWQADRRCPFCGRAFSVVPVAGLRCGRCDSPLAPAPSAQRLSGELVGRRHGERFARDIAAQVVLPGATAGRAARLRDLSLTGLALAFDQRVAKGTALRVGTAHFDAVAVVVACRAAGLACTLHVRLLTLEILRAASGVYVSARA